MATVESVTGRVRLGLGDEPDPFRSPIRGDGEQKDFELGQRNLSASSISVYTINPDNTTTPLVDPTDYTIDVENGFINFVVAPEPDQQVMIEGQSGGMFSDAELSYFIEDAFAMHSSDRLMQKRYTDSHGFIVYDKVPMTLETLPDREVPLVSTLATIDALWALVTDAASDINIQTPEGTSLNRAQRFSQLTEQIQRLTDFYKERSLALGVGLYAPEVSAMRRKSRMTGRLVPLFESREYDENGPPVRVLPPVTGRDRDADGPASPWWPGGVGGN